MSGINKKTVPISEKAVLTVQECAALTGIGQNKLESLLKVPDCPFLLKNGSKKMIIRARFDEYICEHQII